MTGDAWVERLIREAEEARVYWAGLYSMGGVDAERVAAMAQERALRQFAEGLEHHRQAGRFVPGLGWSDDPPPPEDANPPEAKGTT